MGASTSSSFADEIKNVESVRVYLLIPHLQLILG